MAAPLKHSQAARPSVGSPAPRARPNRPPLDKASRLGQSSWLIDVIVSFGGADKAVAQLRECVFKGRSIKFLGPTPDCEGFAVMEW